MLSATKHLGSGVRSFEEFTLSGTSVLTSGGNLLRFMHSGYLLAPTRLANDAKLRQIGNDASASTASQSSNLQGVRASITACSGKSKGGGVPLHFQELYCLNKTFKGLIYDIYSCIFSSLLKIPLTYRSFCTLFLKHNHWFIG